MLSFSVHPRGFEWTPHRGQIATVPMVPLVPVPAVPLLPPMLVADHEADPHSVWELYANIAPQQRAPALPPQEPQRVASGHGVFVTSTDIPNSVTSSMMHPMQLQQSQSLGSGSMSSLSLQQTAHNTLIGGLGPLPQGQPQSDDIAQFGDNDSNDVQSSEDPMAFYIEGSLGASNEPSMQSVLPTQRALHRAPPRAPERMRRHHRNDRRHRHRFPRYNMNRNNYFSNMLSDSNSSAVFSSEIPGFMNIEHLQHDLSATVSADQIESSPSIHMPIAFNLAATPVADIDRAASASLEYHDAPRLQQRRQRRRGDMGASESVGDDNR